MQSIDFGDKDDTFPHFVVDETGRPFDTHIEDLFNDLYHGHPLDATFRNNFRQYYLMLSGLDTTDIPEAVFDNVIQARAWIERAFSAKLLIQPINETTASDDAALAHCTHVATLNSAIKHLPDGIAAAAPSSLYAALLAVVIVFRYYASDFIAGRFDTANKLPI